MTSPAKKKLIVKVTCGSALASFCVTHLILLVVSGIVTLITTSSPYLYFFSSYENPSTSFGGTRSRQELISAINFLAPHISHQERYEIVQSVALITERFRLDPLFIFAVMYEESRFRRGSVSEKGAQGLMQIMPATGEYVEAVLLNRRSEPNSLFQISHNILVGTRYLSYLAERFDDNWFHALVAYNWGPTRLQRALSEGESIPGVVSRYADRVLKRYSALKNQHEWQV